MKHSSRRTRTTADLPDSVHRLLNMYALAAGAAGVSVLALAQPSEAKIVYTPVNKVLGYGMTALDLNNDGKPDFDFCISLFGTVSGTTRHVYSCPSVGRRAGRAFTGNMPPAATVSLFSIFPPKAHIHRNRIVGNTSGAYALPSGVWVGPGQFKPGGRRMAGWMLNGFSYSFGPWRMAQHRYLGLRFLINREVVRMALAPAV